MVRSGPLVMGEDGWRGVIVLHWIIGTLHKIPDVSATLNEIADVSATLHEIADVFTTLLISTYCKV